MVVTLKHGSNLKAMNEILKKLSLLRASKEIDAKKYCGVIQFEESPVSIQKKMRDEKKI